MCDGFLETKISREINSFFFFNVYKKFSYKKKEKNIYLYIVYNRNRYIHTNDEYIIYMYIERKDRYAIAMYIARGQTRATNLIYIYIYCCCFAILLLFQIYYIIDGVYIYINVYKIVFFLLVL